MTAAPDLERRAAAGVAWTSASRIGQQLFQLLVFVLLARLLAPAEFGLMAMIGLAVGFAGIFVEFGLGAALVQRREPSEAQLRSAFSLALAIGFIVAGLFWLGAPVAAAFFRTPALTRVTRGLAPVFVLSALGVVPRAILQSRLAFSALARADLATTIAAGAVGIGLALRGYGVWSLVAQALVAAAVGSLILTARSGWIPRLAFDRRAIRDLLNYSAYLTGFTTINYWARHVDDLLIGRTMGAMSLGLYDRAYTLMLLPVTQLAGTVGSVMLPVFSSVQDDHARVRSLYLRATGLVAFLGFPLMIGLAVVAEPFVLAIFGPAWRAAIPIVRVLALVGVLQSVLSPVGWIYTSQGRTDVFARWGLFASLTIIAAILVGVWIGKLQAIAWAYLVANALLLLPGVAVPARLIGLDASRVLLPLARPLLASAIMAAACVALGRFVRGDLRAPMLLLVFQVGIGAVVYAVASILLRSPQLADLRGLRSRSAAITAAEGGHA